MSHTPNLVENCSLRNQFLFDFFFFLIWKSKDLCKIGTMEANSNKDNEFI